MTKIKAVIFDCDGLLIDTETPWYLALKEIYESYQLDLPLEVYAQCIGSNFDGYDPYFSLKKQAQELVNIDETKNKARTIHKRLMKEQQLRPGVVEYLQDAKRLGLKVALASSSNREWIEEQLKAFQILSFFDSIHTGDTVERVKPFPDLYEAALRSLHVKKEEAVVFEDSLNGLKAANNAGIPCVVIPNEVTAHLPFKTHTHKLASMGDMPLESLLQKLS
ncbi:HAD family hydrolase [Evansella cellulosilytica]|uniref:HAD-superfamily hydrolase, subfamily IA, variant 3 n=1 Tax=Evansella cellulosilytica (strain ATCC 21833 / DSM 2522 / FERM P-1141 / JCM 9156 / N-4) TaxID=649639 RepID=E6U005_EVAC2|nr:HAD family hydrolase [Evansella cellulosilytica]ADU29009.1 HAD-superfamily hydrolase, subfamily IA, variant 3 [Evansella cellulosilytica DSM 2522]